MYPNEAIMPWERTSPVRSSFLPRPASPQAQSRTSFVQEWPALVEWIERAQIVGDVQDLIDARMDCRQWLDGVLTDLQRALVRYAFAYANSRLPSPSLALDDDARDELGDEAVHFWRRH